MEKIAVIENLKPFLQKNWEKSQFKTMTSIQENAIPVILDGNDIIAESPTGTGKTLAYLLPVIDKIDTKIDQTQVVILASSHELVMQIHQEVQKWTLESDIRSTAIIGGANIKRQIEKLKNKPHIISGTPGRLFDLIKMKKIKMHHVQTIVLDEADQLLVPEHTDTVKEIIKSALADRQILLFSATLIDRTEQEAKIWMRDPTIIRISKEKSLPQVEHVYFVSEQREKIEVLRKLARMENMKGIAFMEDIGKLSVFAQKFIYKKIPVGLLHSDMKKKDRVDSIKAFREGKFPLLLATDVAARGLDIKDVTHVIHLDIPKEVKQYVHRSGRTGRIGATNGTVASIVTPQEELKLKKIAKKLNVHLKKKMILRGQIMDISKKNLDIK